MGRRKGGKGAKRYHRIQMGNATDRYGSRGQSGCGKSETLKRTNVRDQKIRSDMVSYLGALNRPATQRKGAVQYRNVVNAETKEFKRQDKCIFDTDNNYILANL